jgi:hypothetical protein
MRGTVWRNIMKKQKIILMLLLQTLLFIDLSAQTMPLVFEVENTSADCPKPPLPSFNYLPTIQALPDPFGWADGRGRMLNFSDWRYRRAEISAEIQYYEIGERPVRPDTIEASFSADSVLTVIVTVNGKKLTLTSKITIPAGSGPFPAVIGMSPFGGTGSIPPEIFTSRNIAIITFNHNQISTYGGPNNTNPFYQLYPHLNVDNTGQYSGWSWGVSRIIDGLELVQNVLPIDLKHICVTGCSYAGKLALFAGAFDERIALTISQESGGGGYTTWRVSELKKGSVETLGATDYNWFRNSMSQFSSAVAKLPEDHHELMAMVAPRALLVTGNPSQIWLSDSSGYIGSKAAKEVWKALGVPDRFGYSIVTGHSHCSVPSSQVLEIEAFVDKFLLGKDTTINVSTAIPSYDNADISTWIPWTTPILSNDTTIFTTLLSPSNDQKDLDTTITFQWNGKKEAQKYFFQLSLDPIFTTTVESDSTTDTVKTITGLLQGKRYYWRIQVKGNAGLGPWSDIWNFVTLIALPVKPQIGIATLLQNRTDFITFSWNKVKGADQYLLQTSNAPDFVSVFLSASTIDTIRTLQYLLEGKKYYWRVQASNIEGSGPWSDVWDFTTILSAPTDLALQRSAFNEITLNWNNHTTAALGYVIERKQSPQTSFTLLDTLKGNGHEYVDKNAEQAQTNTYRTKAYTIFAESNYSNEAFLSSAGVKEEKKIPTEYSISQNYPNPFNPSTKIEFALPQRALTKIIVYDLLGREIQTLVNRELEIGYHEINFDPGNLQSGIYFYRIQSGDFIQTKKMILIK